jgi:hypothetical protein
MVMSSNKITIDGESVTIETNGFNIIVPINGLAEKPIFDELSEHGFDAAIGLYDGLKIEKKTVSESESSDDSTEQLDDVESNPSEKCAIPLNLAALLSGYESVQPVAFSFLNRSSGEEEKYDYLDTFATKRYHLAGTYTKADGNQIEVLTVLESVKEDGSFLTKNKSGWRSYRPESFIGPIYVKAI